MAGVPFLLLVKLGRISSVMKFFAWIVSWALEFEDRRRPGARFVELVELPDHLGDHRLPGDETDPGVRCVEDVVAGQLAELGCGCHA
jgi:hypothetical protein